MILSKFIAVAIIRDTTDKSQPGSAIFIAISQTPILFSQHIEYYELMTDFDTVCKILSEIHVAYTEEGDHADFAEFNDLGVPLAYFVHEGLAVPSQEGKDKILETWELLLKAQELEDTGFSELDDLLD